MADLLMTLISRDRPAGVDLWRSFLDSLATGRLRRGEAVAVLTSLTTKPPDHDTLEALVLAMAERRGTASPELAGAVNIVGTGGGPATFNVSTAAAVVAAALGVPVVKTGSRAYSSHCGSFDLLDHLGIPRAGSYEQVSDSLAEFGIAFAGYFVYPREIALLERETQPLGLRTVGRFMNTIGPFLADIRVSGQLTGVADAAQVPTLRFLAEHGHAGQAWLCTNDHAADELLSFDTNIIHPTGGSPRIAPDPGELDLAPGTMADLHPASDGSVVDHFLGVLAGQAPAPAVQTVCLNAAALALLGGGHQDWPSAYAAATRCVRDGAVSGLLRRLREGRR